MTTPRTELDTRFSEPGAQPTSWEDTLEAIKRAEIFWISTVRTEVVQPPPSAVAARPRCSRSDERRRALAGSARSARASPSVTDDSNSTLRRSLGSEVSLLFPERPESLRRRGATALEYFDSGYRFAGAHWASARSPSGIPSGVGTCGVSRRYHSASSAAMQPLPAAVTAWR